MLYAIRGPRRVLSTKITAFLNRIDSSSGMNLLQGAMDGQEIFPIATLRASLRKLTEVIERGVTEARKAISSGHATRVPCRPSK
ncbi:MAG TPA: hypothetical protein VK577_26345, partial [Bradyrhizobium sp.]|nr:hypothetical protein [Bradyrhizobium sp.]